MEEKREREPRMHSAEHILNQTMVRMFNKGRSFSAHVEKKKSKCDYHFDRALTENEITEIQQRVNSIIKLNLKVHEEFIPRDMAEIEFNLARLPGNVGDLIRIIKIGDYDSCPCSGIHVNSTSEIGIFRIISSDFANGVLRIRFKLDDD